MEERIFCLRRRDIETRIGGPLPQGSFNCINLEEILAVDHVFFPKSKVEQDEDYKQIIPYQVFRCEERLFVYQRGGSVGENRLAGYKSIGIGGHINSGDSKNGFLTPAAYHESLMRERGEELICSEEVMTDFAGWINDDSDPVGRVHLGAVHICRLPPGKHISLRHGGEDIHEQGWWSPEEIGRRQEEFEKWSMLALELIKGRRDESGNEVKG